MHDRLRYYERGGIALTLALIIFIISALAAGGVLFLLWQDSGRSWTNLQQVLKGGTPVPPREVPANTNDPLEASLVVASELAGERADFERQLLTPLRSYYATRTERLMRVEVLPADTDDHSTHVTLTVTENGEKREHTFFYDRGGEDLDGPYPKWEVALLDTAP